MKRKTEKQNQDITAWDLIGGQYYRIQSWPDDRPLPSSLFLNLSPASREDLFNMSFQVSCPETKEGGFEMMCSNPRRLFGRYVFNREDVSLFLHDDDLAIRHLHPSVQHMPDSWKRNVVSEARKNGMEGTEGDQS